MQTSKPLPDLLVPPSTDHGLPNLRFSFADAHIRLEPRVWTRQVTAREFGISKTIRRRENAARVVTCLGVRNLIPLAAAPHVYLHLARVDRTFQLATDRKATAQIATRGTNRRGRQAIVSLGRTGPFGPGEAIKVIVAGPDSVPP